MAHNMDMHDHERIQMRGFEVEGFRVSGLRLGLRVSTAKNCGRWGLGPGILGVAKNQLCNMLGGGRGGEAAGSTFFGDPTVANPLVTLNPKTLTPEPLEPKALNPEPQNPYTLTSWLPRTTLSPCKMSRTAEPRR